MGKKTDMGNKQKAAAASKIIDDKTFGLKNKNKSKKVMRYVAEVTKNTKASFVDQKKQKEEDIKAKAKADKKAHKEETAALFKVSISQPKVPFGVDPKTIACAHFKAGQCKNRGDKCKFSHDQEICFGKKKAVGNKIDLTVDVTKKGAGTAKKKDDDIAITDPVELEKAIAKKAAQMKCETHIVCMHFLKAIETKKYGWFWECPDMKDGGECKYRHALPPGYVFKDKKKSGDDSDDESDKRTLEQKLDDMRKGVGPGAMVTKETFAEWKRKRNEKAEQDRLKKEAEMKKAYKKSGAKTTLTGRQLFEIDSSLFVDDVEASGSDAYKLEFGDVADMEAAEAKLKANQAARLEGCDGAGTEAAAAAEAAAADPAEVELPAGIEENLFLDEDLDDLPSDED